MPGFIKVKLLKMKIQKTGLKEEASCYQEQCAKAEARELEGAGQRGGGRAPLPVGHGTGGVLPGPGRSVTREKQGCPHLGQVWARSMASLFSQLARGPLCRWSLAGQGCLRMS